VGRASNRKKANRQAEQRSRADAATRQAMLQVANALQSIVEENQAREQREAAARRTWCGGAEPVPAEAPRWAEDSLGDRFFGGFHLDQARNAPSLATAQIPDAAVIAADPAHWNVATNALVRAVVFDGLAQDHPAVSTLLEVLAPIAEAELAYGEAADAIYGAGLDRIEDEPEFPEQDGPVFLLGACVLVDAVWAALGLDPLNDVLDVLLPVLDDAIPGLDGQVAADALIGAFTKHYRCEMPGDAELLQRIEHCSGDALENLVRARAVPPRDVLPTGLTLLSALSRLCRSDSPSLLQPAMTSLTTGPC
jgi:hypothetical protein